MFFDCHTHISQSENSIKNISYNNVNEIDNLKNKYFSFGVHPWDVENINVNAISSIVQNVSNDTRLVAIGECGIDKIKNKNLLKQEVIFELQLDLAKQLNLPVIIHCVKCFDLLFKYIKLFPELTFVIHAYHGNVFQTKQLLKYNVFFSFGTNILTHNQKLLETIKFVPIERVFFETDDSDSNVEAQYKRFSEIKNISIQHLIDSVVCNVFNVFNISEL